MTVRSYITVAIRVVILAWLLSLVKPPQVLVTLGEQQTVNTRNPIAGVHARFIDEAEAWKIQRGLSMIREMGASWVVEFFPWAYIEPQQGVFDWVSSDRIVDHANRQGLRLIARLGFVPAWARPESNVAATTFTYLDETHYDDFARFAAAFTSHFKGRIEQIVIWNEPNLSGEWGMRPVDPASYARMLSAVYEPMKQANPSVVVLAGALAPTLEPVGSAQGMNDLDYLDALYLALEGNTLDGQPNRPYDGWAIHTYGRTDPPENAPDHETLNFRRAELLHAMMKAHGDGTLPVYITESGWNDDIHWVFGVTPAQRIQYTLRAWDYAESHWSWARCVTVWVFKLPADAHGYRDHYAFVTPSLEPLPIYDEIKKALVP